MLLAVFSCCNPKREYQDYIGRDFINHHRSFYLLYSGWQIIFCLTRSLFHYIAKAFNFNSVRMGSAAIQAAKIERFYYLHRIRSQRWFNYNRKRLFLLLVVLQRNSIDYIVSFFCSPYINANGKRWQKTSVEASMMISQYSFSSVAIRHHRIAHTYITDKSIVQLQLRNCLN